MLQLEKHYSWALAGCIIFWLCLFRGWVFSRILASGVGMVAHFSNSNISGQIVPTVSCSIPPIQQLRLHGFGVASGFGHLLIFCRVQTLFHDPFFSNHCPADCEKGQWWNNGEVMWKCCWAPIYSQLHWAGRLALRAEGEYSPMSYSVQNYVYLAHFGFVFPAESLEI